jgi:hypothetical protein
MSKWLHLRSTGLVLGLVCGLGMFLCSGAAARAATLEIDVKESAGPDGTIKILDNMGLDTDPTVGIINVNTALLNLSLFNYQFTTLGANSNSPGTAVTGFLSQSGVAQLLIGGTGSISILASDINYNLPNIPPGTMVGSASSTFTNATAGNTDTFQSWFNGNNALGAKTPPGPRVVLTSTALNPNSQSADTAPTPITLVNPYGLTNEKVITLTGGTPGGAPSALAQDGYSASTTITGAVPEPTSMALMLAALPVWIFGVMRRRKAKAA